MNEISRKTFEELRKLGWDYLQKLIAAQYPESSVVDYIDHRGWKQDSNYPAKNIVKPIVGLSNHLGGLLFYGVPSQGKDQSGRDLPSEPKNPVPPMFQDSIAKLAATQVDPSITELEFLELPSQSESLVLVVMVPPSFRKPHQSLFDNIYYQRTDDDTIPMRHSMLDLLFRDRIWRELNQFPLATFGARVDISQHLGIRGVLANRGNSPALNLRVMVGDQIERSLPILAPREEITITRQLSEGPTDQWKRFFIEWGIGQCRTLTIEYTDLAGAKYVVERKAKAVNYTGQKSIDVEEEMLLTRNGLRLV